ncbi:hypothetical protein HII31_00580 [Pseudocercospora fuligena]|uniref:Fork-head domain-containing protein n=1 Tax=Pseudocercospora fuligena TaxID=685502 RepID=A0A8H6VRT9_9PEZI|nr:hypothetical protein HII31_00580 [Pseudocercospora fuligena]
MAAAERDTRQGDHEARVHLRNEVANLIRPFRTSTVRPPFTLGELIVIAILVQKKKNINEAMIVKWIIDTFEYYSRPEHHSTFPGHGHGWSDIRIGGFIDALSNIETPITAKRFRVTYNQQQVFEIKYAVDTAPARSYLARQLEPPREGEFRFLDLPTELRNRIYNMLFVHETPLTSQDECYSDGSPNGQSAGNLICLTPLCHPQLPRSRLDFCAVRRGRDYHNLLVESPAITLALTQTCKQVYEESKGIFYGMNTFVFEDQRAFFNRAMRMGRNFQRLRKVSIELHIDRYQYNRYEDAHIEELRGQLRGLRQLPSLRLDKLILPHDIREPAEGEEDCDNCDNPGVHDIQFTALGDLLDPIVSMAKRAKSVEVGYMPGCTSFKRFILRKVAERQTVKMLCCADVAAKEREEFKLF